MLNFDVGVVAKLGVHAILGTPAGKRDSTA